MGFEATTTVVVLVSWLALLVYLLAGLRDEESLPKPPARPRMSETMLKILGVIMSALDDALARFTAFVKDVAAQLTGAKEANDTQTGKLAELQAALDAALSDDAADKSAISALQAEVSSLQDEVAAKINAAVDAVANAQVTDEVSVTTDTPAAVDETGDAPVE